MAHEADDMDTPTIAIVGLIAAGATFAAIYLVMWLYYWVSSRQEAARLDTPYSEPERVLSQQRAILTETQWIDQNTGQLRIPVDRAMTLVVSQLQQTPSDAGVTPEQFAGVDATVKADAGGGGVPPAGGAAADAESADGRSADGRSADEAAAGRPEDGRSGAGGDGPEEGESDDADSQNSAAAGRDSGESNDQPADPTPGDAGDE